MPRLASSFAARAVRVLPFASATSPLAASSRSHGSLRSSSAAAGTARQGSMRTAQLALNVSRISRGVMPMARSRMVTGILRRLSTRM